MQYISNTEQDKSEMLAAIGVPDFEHLVQDIPSVLRRFSWDLPKGMSELELVREMVETGRANRHFHHFASYLGAGNYDHFIPTVVTQLAHRGEFLTAYTPYQGEASQGTLQSIYEYQSLICELTGMDASNASMYDGASALAEAVLLAVRFTGRNKVLLPETLHPEYLAVIRTYVSRLGTKLVTLPMEEGAVTRAALDREADEFTAAVVLQQPNFFGILEEAKDFSDAAHHVGALLVACVNPISLGILKPPGEYGADIAVGEGQPLGNPVSFGGPHFGFFTVSEALLRKIPGRIAGMTVDKKGNRAFVLTLQAREQHIRREKATSNICTNQALCALKAAIFLSLLGPNGIRKLALLNWRKAHDTRDRLLRLRGVRPFSGREFFNEFALRIDKDKSKLASRLDENRIMGPLDLSRFFPSMKDAHLFAVTEKRTDADAERLVQALEAA